MAYKQTNEASRDEHAVIGGAAAKKVFVLDNAGNQIVNFGSTATVTVATGNAYIGLVTVTPATLGVTAVSSVASISTVPTIVSPTNLNRFSIVVRNVSNTTICIGFTSNMTTASMYLRQDDNVTLDRYRGPVFGLVAAGSGEVRFLEESV